MAHALQTAIEAYRVPEHLSQGSRTLGRLFIDDEELSAGGELKLQLVRAIEASEFLVVVCSEAAAKAFRGGFMEQEIECFQARQGGQDRILPVLSHGKPCVLDNMGLHIEGRQRLALDVRKWSRRRPFQDRYVLQVIAPLLGCELTELTDREGRRARTRARKNGVLAILFAAMAILAVWFWVQSEIQRSRAQARMNDVLSVARLVFLTQLRT